MRDKNYRRKQEAKHYKKRLNNAMSKGYYKELIIDDEGTTKLLPLNHYKNHEPWINQTGEKTAIEKNQYKRWKFALKNDSMPSDISSWSKRYCRRTRRHYQKMVDYKLPDKKWLVRAQVIYPRDIV